MEQHLEHLHLVVTAWVDEPPMTAQEGENWLRRLVSLVDMQILMDAKALYCEDLGNEGVTGIVGLTTSHSSFHSWHAAKAPFVSFDIYSCRSFLPEVVFQHLMDWKMTKCEYILIDRNPETGMKIVDQGTFIPSGN
jgi:S-adenosylmethionine/arginine decarboxylase-like enzyme